MSSDEIARMSELINMGKPRDAIAVAEAVNLTESGVSAQFYFQWGLAKCLIMEDDAAEHYFELARHCPDYPGELMEGDMLRDLALVKIRRHELSGVSFLLNKSGAFHAGDANRTAANYMAWARYFYSYGDFNYACDAHAQANLIWHDIPDADQQWIKNNNFHWLRASVRACRAERFRVGRRVLLTEQRRDRKLAAILMLCMGKKGVDMVDAREGNQAIS